MNKANLKFMVRSVFNKLKIFFSLLNSLFLWLIPLSVFLLATYIPKILWNLGFIEYIDFLKILVWPYTTLVILFFFKKVFTYLFFSMDEFNFFGTKGNLRNVNEVILSEVDKKFIERENDERRQIYIDELSADIKKKEEEIKMAKGDANENLRIAKEIMEAWKESTKKSEENTNDITGKYNKLKEIFSELKAFNKT